MPAGSTLPAAHPAALPRRRVVSAGYFTAFILLGMVSASLGPTLPWLADNLGAALSEMSYLFSLRSLGYLTGSFFSGRLYDRVPGNPLLAGVVVLIGVMMALVPGMPLLWMMAGALFVVGVCQGFIDVGGNTLMVWLHGERSGPPMNALHFFWGVGAFLMPLVVAQVALLTNQVNAAYIALAVLMLPAALWLLRLPSPSAPAAASGVAGKASLRSDVLLVSMIMAFFLLYTGAEVSVGGWVYTYAVTLWPAAKVTAALITSGFWGALTVGRLLAIPLATRLSPEKMILIDLSGALISLALIVLFPGVQMALWVGVIGVGLFLASIFPTMLAFAGQRMAVTGKTTGWFLVGANLGAMSLPWLVGQLFAPVGPRVVFWIVLIAVALEFSLFLTILARTRKHG